MSAPTNQAAIGRLASELFETCHDSDVCSVVVRRKDGDLSPLWPAGEHRNFIDARFGALEGAEREWFRRYWNLSAFHWHRRTRTPLPADAHGRGHMTY